MSKDQQQETPGGGVFAGGGEMGALMRSIDWSRTPVGRVSGWSQALRTTVGLLLRSRFPMLLWWGPRFVQFYNDAYVPIPGAKHPGAMGQSASECWAEIWHIIGPMIEAPYSGQPATWSDDLSLLINRKGFLEETHFKVAYSPVPDETVQPTGVGGVLATVAETTEQVYGERQLKTLRELGTRAAEARTPQLACEMAAATFAENGFDVPFALFYLVDPGENGARLAASCGFEGRGTHSGQVDPEPPLSAKAWPLARITETRAIEVLAGLRARFGTLPSGQWTESPHSAIALPLASPGEPAYGVLIAGLSPHRTLDEGYRTFFELAAAQIVTAIRNANAHEEQRLRAEKLAEIDHAKTAFFSNISHEFRTPLTLMLGPLEDALSGATPSLSGESLDVTYRGAVRLLKLVNTLLDFSRIEAGRLQASYEPVDLASITVELAGVFRSAIERAGLALVLHCEPLAEPVYVDREMWEKIVLNLISNAFKFTFEGEIEIALRPANGHVELVVRDTGIGISAEELPRLFERFHRVEGARARTHEGSGIGLSFVQELVRLHGGEISAESEYGRGTVFSVKIPTGTQHLPKDRIVAARPHAPAGARAGAFLEEALRWLPEATDSPLEAPPPAERDQPRAAARILVVDDNADLRGYLRRILGARWQVETAADGEAALQMARHSPPDLVLTDVMMPGISGFGLLSELKRDARTHSIPVIMLSARAGEEARVEGLDAGADDYLIKPFSARELIARVGSQLALSASYRERAELLERELAARKEADLQKQHVASLFTLAPTPIVILRGPRYVIELANPETCRIWGRRYEDVINKPLLEALPELSGQVFASLLDGVMSTGVPYMGKETPVEVDRHGNGTLETVYFNFVYAPLRNVEGDIDGVLVFAFDVTDEVRSREQMRRLRAEAEVANRAKDQFLAMLSHELRNPLAPMLTALQLMKLRGDASREQDVLGRQVGHLTRLVDDLLDISRITGGKVELRKQPTEIADVVVRAVELASPLFEQRRQRLNLRVPPRGLAVNVDPDRMAQVISNLLTNAAKYSESGSEIVVVAAKERETVRIRVQDQGVGIAPEMLDSVFDMFVQQPQTLDRSKGGLGLGLAIAKSLVELHGGRMTVRSEGEGRGSEFSIDLPAHEPSQLQPEGLSLQSTASRPPGSGQKRVLVVDDNEDAVRILRSALELLGYAVEVAYDGPSALSAAEVFQPEVALLDIGLPVMDGYELATRLRELPRSAPDLRLVAVTGYGQDADRQRAAAAGFEQHLIKPVDLGKLERVIEGFG